MEDVLLVIRDLTPLVYTVRLIGIPRMVAVSQCADVRTVNPETVIIVSFLGEISLAFYEPNQQHSESTIQKCSVFPVEDYI